MKVYILEILLYVQIGVNCQLHASAALSSIDWIGGSVGPRCVFFQAVAKRREFSLFGNSDIVNDVHLK